jgi:hypothetical protein
MAEIDALKSRFIVDDDVINARLEVLVTKALEHCVVDKRGKVHVNNIKLASRDKLKLALAARQLASQLEPTIPSQMSVNDLMESTGLPRDQVRARMSEIVKERFAVPSDSGVFSAVLHKIESFLDSLKS